MLAKNPLSLHAPLGLGLGGGRKENSSVFVVFFVFISQLVLLFLVFRFLNSGVVSFLFFCISTGWDDLSDRSSRGNSSSA